MRESGGQPGQVSGIISKPTWKLKESQNWLCLVYPETAGVWLRSWLIPFTFLYIGQEVWFQGSPLADSSSPRSISGTGQSTQYQVQYRRLPEGGALERCGQCVGMRDQEPGTLVNRAWDLRRCRPCSWPSESMFRGAGGDWEALAVFRRL